MKNCGIYEPPPGSKKNIVNEQNKERTKTPKAKRSLNHLNLFCVHSHIITISINTWSHLLFTIYIPTSFTLQETTWHRCLKTEVLVGSAKCPNLAATNDKVVPPERHHNKSY